MLQDRQFSSQDFKRLYNVYEKASLPILVVEGKLYMVFYDRAGHQTTTSQDGAYNDGNLKYVDSSSEAESARSDSRRNTMPLAHTR